MLPAARDEWHQPESVATENHPVRGVLPGRRGQHTPAYHARQRRPPDTGPPAEHTAHRLHHRRLRADGRNGIFVHDEGTERQVVLQWQRPRRDVPQSESRPLYLCAAGQTEEPGLGGGHHHSDRHPHRATLLAVVAGLDRLRTGGNGHRRLAHQAIQTAAGPAQLTADGTDGEPAEAGVERGAAALLHQHYPRTAHTADAHPRPPGRPCRRP